MRCEQCVTLLEDFVEGELGETACAETFAHLAACAACARLHEELKREQAVYAQYLLGVQASPRLWPSLRANIEEEKAARAAHPLNRIRESLTAVFDASPAVAALTAALVLGFGVWMAIRPPAAVNENGPAPLRTAPHSVADAARPSDTTTVEAARARTSAHGRGVRVRRASPPVAGASGLPSASARSPQERYAQAQAELVGRAEREYLKAISILSRDVGRRRSKMSADDRAQSAKALATLDRTIDETRVAARRQPGDPQAVRFMLAAYAKKVDVLQELVGY